MHPGRIGEIFNGFTEMMWTPRYREPREVRELRRSSEHLEQRLEAYKRELASVQSDLDDCEEELRSQKERATQIKKAEEVAQERYRQQSELLSRCRDDLDISIQENARLTVNINKLQQQTGRLSEEEVKGTMGQLYHALNLWTQRHFRSPSNDKSPAHLTTSMGRHDAIFQAQAQVALMLFENLLGYDRVTIFDQDTTEMFDSIEQGVRAEFPTHIVHHWKSATSMGLFKLNRHRLEDLCDDSVSNLEVQLGENSLTSTARRTEELKRLIWDFVQFKQRLECQMESYHFALFDQGSPFDDALMSSFTGVHASDSVVEYTMFPALYMVAKPNNDQTVVEKAKVMVLSPPKQSLESPFKSPSNRPQASPQIS